MHAAPSGGDVCQQFAHWVHRADGSQAYARHPYANTGFGAAFAIGLAAWLYVSYSKPAVTAVAHNGKVRGADA